MSDNKEVATEEVAGAAFDNNLHAYLVVTSKDLEEAYSLAGTDADTVARSFDHLDAFRDATVDGAKALVAEHCVTDVASKVTYECTDTLSVTHIFGTDSEHESSSVDHRIDLARGDDHLIDALSNAIGDRWDELSKETEEDKSE